MSTTDGHANRLDAVLAGLPCHGSDPVRAALTRGRAHALMHRRQRRRTVGVIVLYRQHRALVELTLAGACSLFYLSDVIRRAMRLWE